MPSILLGSSSFSLKTSAFVRCLKPTFGCKNNLKLCYPMPFHSIIHASNVTLPRLRTQHQVLVACAPERHDCSNRLARVMSPPVETIP